MFVWIDSVLAMPQGYKNEERLLHHHFNLSLALMY